MIDKDFWINVAEHWRIEDDIEIPPIVIDVKPDDIDDISEEELDDIMADLGFDDF